MNKHIGSDFDDFLSEEGLLEKVTERTLKNTSRWRFMTDNDGHWYLIPVELEEEEFNKLLAEGEDDYYTEFNNKFYDNYSIGCHPSCYTFENPKENY